MTRLKSQMCWLFRHCILIRMESEQMLLKWNLRESSAPLAKSCIALLCALHGCSVFCESSRLLSAWAWWCYTSCSSAERVRTCKHVEEPDEVGLKPFKSMSHWPPRGERILVINEVVVNKMPDSLLSKKAKEPVASDEAAHESENGGSFNFHNR